MQEDIGWLDVSVEDVSFAQVGQAPGDVEHDLECLDSPQSALFVDFGGQVARGAQFGHNVAIIDGDKDVFAGEKVRVAESLDDCDFRLE